LDAGDAERSRQLLEGLAAGEERERALALLDRLDDREGRLGPLQGSGTPRAESPSASATARPLWLRRSLLAFWSLVIVSLGAGLAGSWDRLVGGLVEPPEPASASAPPATEQAAPRPGERALEQASRLLAQGDPAGAVQVLDGVPADDPAYPFSLKLRLDAQAALANQGRYR
jgi:hypothetical protein